MKKLISALFGAMVCITASAEVLPSWAVGTYKGEVKNWCYVYDDPNDIGPWYGTATLSVAAGGKVSGEINFGDLIGKPQGNYTVVEVSGSQVRIQATFNWKEGRQVIDVSTSDIVVRNSGSGVLLEYIDTDSEYTLEESCPVEGVLSKTSSGSTDGTIPAEWQKARTLRGVATRAMPNPVVGIFELKCGKANKKTGVAKVSAVLTGIDGKKKSYKGESVDVRSDIVTADIGGLSITINGDSFNGNEGLPGGLSVESLNAGGNWTRTDTKVYVDATNLPTGAVDALLPAGEPVLAKGGKWAFNKASSVKLSKDKTNLEWDTSNGKTNLSGLKLTYTPKTGLFKGSFKVYALEGFEGKKKLKKYSAKVTGVVVDEKGYGQATIKKPSAGPWPVVVE